MAAQSKKLHRKPWAVTSLGTLGLGTFFLFLALRPASVEVEEPRPRTSRWPSDPAITASLVGFMAERYAETAEVKAWSRDFERGIALGLFSKDIRYDYDDLLGEIREHDANWVSLFFNLFQENGTSTSIAPPTSIPEQERIIVQSAREAHALGLRVMAFPVVLLAEAGPKQWRGNLEPEDVGAWFAEYEAHLIRLARLAEREKIEAFCVGSEFSSLEKYEDRWRAVIAHVREVYSGRLIYSANWDHYAKVDFWDAVDAVGLSGYYELTRDKDATLDQLTDAWAFTRDKILAWHGANAPETPILFTEIGYANIDGTNLYPWDYTMAGDPDPAEQALCYEAFIRAWTGVDALQGVYFYNWFGLDTLEDTGYSPRGKPAAQVLRTWYSGLRQGPGPDRKKV